MEQGTIDMSCSVVFKAPRSAYNLSGTDCERYVLRILDSMIPNRVNTPPEAILCATGCYRFLSKKVPRQQIRAASQFDWSCLGIPTIPSLVDAIEENCPWLCCYIIHAQTIRGASDMVG